MIIVDIDAFNSTCNARTDLVHVGRGIRVIGRFEVASMQPVQEHAYQNNTGADTADDQSLSGNMESFLLVFVFIARASLALMSGAIRGFLGYSAITFPV